MREKKGTSLAISILMKACLYTVWALGVPQPDHASWASGLSDQRPRQCQLWCLATLTLRSRGIQASQREQWWVPMYHWVASEIRTLLTWFPGLSLCLSGEEHACQYRRHGFNPWVRKIPWNRKWQPTPVFLPGTYHSQRNLVGYSPWDHKSVG